MLRVVLGYWKNIFVDAWKATWSTFGIPGLLFDLVFSGLIASRARGAFDLGAVAMSAAIFVGLIILVWLAYVIVTAAVQDKQQSDRLALKEYEDVDLSFFAYPFGDGMRNLLGHPSDDFLKVGLLLTNHGGLKIRCGLRAISIQYSGRDHVLNWAGGEEEWSNIGNGFEAKFIKWDEGYDVLQGKVEVAPDGGTGMLLLAETQRPDYECRLVYVDGLGREKYRQPGRYLVTLQLEGDVEANAKWGSLRPVRYAVELAYTHPAVRGTSIRKLRSDQPHRGGRVPPKLAAPS
jgi:hypothetical protein